MNYKNLNIKAIGEQQTRSIKSNSLEHFVVDRYIAFIKNNKKKTIQYKINHGPWDLYKVKYITIDKRMLTLLPNKFKNAKYISSVFVDGSYVTVEKGVL